MPMQLQNFDIDLFLREHWQKKPLLIRNALPDWQNPLNPEDLAGLACEEEVESRLIVRKDESWKLEHGPFAEKRFAKLGKKPWTLLVQAVDHFVPEVAALIAPFRFVPNWRIDDVMVSYASDQGGVGPHFDQYDVFLVQGLGRRRWQIGARCDAYTPLMPHDDIRLLANFEASDEWVLEPGDILYVPPGFAHDGVALGDDCMTYSIGFRAPSRNELIEDYSEHLASAADERYGDPALPRQDNPGEISPAAIAQLHEMMSKALLDRDGFARWFGQNSSTRKYPDVDWRPDEPIDTGQLQASLAQGLILSRNPASRFSFIRPQRGGVTLFVDGEIFDCGHDDSAFAEQLCAQETMMVTAEASPAALAIIVALVNQGSVTLEPQD